uniref:DnaJ homolog subfamily C member 2 n=1 Tax=Steinernema glaseri TaxID=37863 RepID=A0A1I8AVH4_9BILA
MHCASVTFVLKVAIEYEKPSLTQLNLAVAVYGFQPRQRVVEKAGIWYEAAVVREKLEKGIDTSPIYTGHLNGASGTISKNSSESDLEVLQKLMDADDEEYLRFVKSLDPKETKNQDHYKVLGLSKLRYKASKNDIKLAYRQKSLNHHPDKRKEKDAAKSWTDDYFVCINNAYTQLYVNDRRAFDSVDPTFDEEIPSASDLNPQKFFDVLGPVFDMNARFSNKQPVPDFGNQDTPRAEVEHFYDFWFDFDSWREFSYLDEENKERGEDRWERRHIEKTNKAEREKKRKADTKRIRTLVETAYAADPRIQRFKELDKQEKEQAKEERRLKQQKKREDERLAQEAERKKREEEEQLAKQKLADEKKQRDLAKKAHQQAKKAFRQAAEAAKYWADCHEKQMKCMEEVERICIAADKDTLASLVASLAAVKLYDEALYLMKNTCKKEVATETTKAASDTSVKGTMTSWTMNENQLLIKASGMFPVGTVDRWNRIAGYINEHRSDKSMKPKTDKDVIKQTKAVQKMEFKPAADQHKLASGILTNSDSNVQKSDDEWTAAEQKKLEEGLKAYPSSDPERWDKIAAMVGNRSKKDCMRRYKKLVEMIRNKKSSG